jgi:hypothetical protein
MKVAVKKPRGVLVNPSFRFSARPSEGPLSLHICFSLVSVSLLLTLSSCGDPLPIQHKTEHLRIASALEHPICEGDLAYYEKIIATVESELETDLSRKIDVFVWSDEQWKEQAKQYCGSPLYRGCYKHNSGTIFTGEYALPHELVHATLGEPSLQVFFDEGIAEMYAGRQTRFAISTPSSHEGENKTPEVYELLTAAHFAHWLRYEWGSERLGELTRLKGAAFRDFEDVYGIPFAVAEQLYFEEAPAAFPALHTCDAPRMDVASSSDTWSTVVELDCESSDETRANGSGLFTSRTFTIDSPGPYYLYADHGWMQAGLCIESPVEELPNAEEELLEEDVPFTHTGFPSGVVRFFPGGEFHPVDLRAGLYVIRVSLGGFEGGAVQVDIWPRKGEHPEPTK